MERSFVKMYHCVIWCAWQNFWNFNSWLTGAQWSFLNNLIRKIASSKMKKKWWFTYYLNSDFEFLEISTSTDHIYWNRFKPGLVLAIQFSDRILEFRSLCRAGTSVVKKFSVSLHPTRCGLESYLFYSRITSAGQRRRCF